MLATQPNIAESGDYCEALVGSAADSRPFRVVVFGLDLDWPHLKRLRDVYLVCRGLASHFIKTHHPRPERQPNPNGDTVLTWSELYVINRSLYNAGRVVAWLPPPVPPPCSSFLAICPPRAPWYISEPCGSQGPLTLSFRLGLWNSAVISWRL